MVYSYYWSTGTPTVPQEHPVYCAEPARMDVAVEWAAWVVGKALGPATDVVLEAWAASVGLGSNVEALKKELLCVKALLEHTRGKEISNSALEEMMQNLRNKAYDAEDVLDELDYFRIQDDLYGLAEAADVHPKGCGHNLVLNARHSAKAVAKRLLYSCACSSPVVGDADPPGMLVPCDEAPKSVFDRVDASMKMMEIVEQLQSMRKVVSEILTPLGPGLITTREIGHNRSSTISESTEPRLYGRDLIMKSIIHDITKGQYCDKTT
ncbi:hypothetical protein PR202_ga18966 [Eleusine coracana subsp. coracana]|uniref:Disease resistance N-terminal domain-containing protein n=1 Tax=Eleusine coracana subsp. coracana TaxID=191504 RepID=A0AAV5CTZ0_ELECO|nr:hypothetical protein PR202_ga18966 [Eleusine coracana subsp. coracana]